MKKGSIEFVAIKNIHYSDDIDEDRIETCDELAEWCKKNDCSQYWNI